MALLEVQNRLEALFGRRPRSRLFPRLWGVEQEPAAVQAGALSGLFRTLRQEGLWHGSVAAHLAAAELELAQNLDRIEALAESRPHPPFAYVTWLWRVAETLRRLTEQRATPKVRPRRPPEKRGPPPLALKEPAPPLVRGRLHGLTIEPLLELARRETRVLGRRRRLLEAARRALLETAAALALPAAQVEPRLLALSEDIQQLTAWQHAGIDAEEDLAHQLRRAVHARDAARTDGLLSMLAQLEQVAPKRHRSLARLESAHRRFARGRGEPLPSLAQASVRALGEAAGHRLLRAAARAAPEGGGRGALELVQAAHSVDAAFELGRSVSPVRAIEEQRRMQEVPFPTQTQVLRAARTVADLPTSLIGDPRLVVYGLATRSLLTRRYLAERNQKRSVRTRYAEARYYLLDGSASMGGRRGRMRDAVLIAELSTMVRHLETGTATARPVVYYRYFTQDSEPVRKVDSIDEALDAIEAVVVRKSRGQTDIQAALLDSFHHIERERGRDANLQRAQLVLITDGAAPVDLQEISRARAALGDMPVRVSVIALGGESEALKELAATQRARGEEVFYHYLSDRALHELLARTRVARPPESESPVATWRPAASESASVPRSEPSRTGPEAASSPAKTEPEPDPPALVSWIELERLVDELQVLQDPPEADELEQAGLLEVAYEELGVSLSEPGFEAERAWADARRRDARAVAARFERWFPDPATLKPSEARPSEELLEVIEIVLASVSELTDYLSGTRLSRRVDAIELIERLLLEAGVAPWTYARALPHATAKSRLALEALRRSAG